MEKLQKKNKMKCLIDKVVKGEIFTFQEEVEYQGRNTYLHRLNEKYNGMHTTEILHLLSLKYETGEKSY